MCGSVGRFRLTTGATSSTKGFGEPWLRRTVASRSFGSDGCMLINKTVKGSVVFIQKWFEKLHLLGLIDLLAETGLFLHPKSIDYFHLTMFR